MPNYIIEYETLRGGEWVRPKYQVMSAADLKELGQKFYGKFSKEENEAERVIWWENGIRQELKKKKNRLADVASAAGRA